MCCFFFFSSRRRHTRSLCDWSSDVCSSDLGLAGAAPEKAAEIDRSRLSFHLAGSLPLDLDFKQTLLGMKSESERVQGIISYFETILPGLRRAVRARKRAGGNGHVD